tara:strand:+ start:101 stop:331 length:231 start_codon:yes stop_codon:yes gene_type:complete
MSWLGLPTFTGYDNLNVIYPNPLPLNMSNWSIEDYDEYHYPPEVEREMEKDRIETDQYWSNFPQWGVETGFDILWL